MSLDDQLRTVLTQEADLRTAPPPDIDGLIRGGRARRRSRSIARLGVVAAVAVLVGGGVYGVAQDGPSDTGSGPTIANTPPQPSESAAATTPPSYRELEAERPKPGTYRMAVGYGEDFDPIEADVTFGWGWSSSSQPVLAADDESSAGGIGVFEARALPGRSGCTQDLEPPPTFREAAATPDALARQLATLPSSEVVQPVESGTALGHDARHLRLRIDATCSGGEVYLVAGGMPEGLGITYTDPWQVVVDLTVVDVEGTPIVAAWWHDDHAPRAMVEEITRVWESISFVPPAPAR
jgi:hypothetical protein